MKITVGQLRAIIREMAMGRIAKKVPVKLPDNWEETPDNIKQIYDVEKNSNAVKKYFKSKSWVEKAQKVYKNIKPEIWIIPRWALELRQNKFLSFDEALPIIEETDFDPDDVAELLEKGGSLWIVDAAEIVQQVWPSPWNTLHAIFDTQYNDDPDLADFSSQTADEIYSFIESFDIDADYIFMALIAVMTMGSARDDNLSEENPADVIAELATQAIQKGRVVLDLSLFPAKFLEKYPRNQKIFEENSVEEFKDILLEIENFINHLNIGQMWDELISGKILNVVVVDKTS
jgi:hypothetical protein